MAKNGYCVKVVQQRRKTRYVEYFVGSLHGIKPVDSVSNIGARGLVRVWLIEKQGHNPDDIKFGKVRLYPPSQRRTET